MASASRADATAELCRRGFLYWAPRRFHILNKREQDQLLTLNQAQRDLYHAEAQMIRETGRARIIELKGRQGGITTYAQARAVHQTLMETGAGALTIADTRDRTDQIFTKVTTYAIDRHERATLPRLGRSRTKEVSVPSQATSFFTATAGDGNTGLGMTLRRVHGSEFAFWKEPKTTMRAVTPVVNRDGTTILLETTASVYGSEAHEFWRAARDGHNGYRAIFLPWWRCDPATYRTPLVEPDELGVLDDDETSLITRYQLTLEEIKWRRLNIRELGGRDEFFQQYPEDDESCWLSAGGMYFSAELLKQLMDNAAVPIRTEQVTIGTEVFDVQVFSELRPGDRAFIGADTAEGVKQDRSTLIARAEPGWRLLRAFASNTIEPKAFGALLDSQGCALGTAFQTVEKNMHGITSLRALRDDHHYPVGAIYHRQPLDSAQAHEMGARIGWATTKESKATMIGAGRELLNAAIAGNATPPCADVVRDAYSVRRDESGQYDLNSRDLLVAEMLCQIGRTAPNAMGMLDFAREQLAQAKAKRESQ